VEAVGSEASALGLGSLGTRADSGQDLAEGPSAGCLCLPKCPRGPRGDLPVRNGTDAAHEHRAVLQPRRPPRPCHAGLDTKRPSGDSHQLQDSLRDPAFTSHQLHQERKTPRHLLGVPVPLPPPPHLELPLPAAEPKELTPGATASPAESRFRAVLPLTAGGGDNA